MAESNGRVSWGWVAGITLPLVFGLAAYLFASAQADMKRTEARVAVLEQTTAAAQAATLVELRTIRDELQQIRKQLGQP